MMRMVSTGHLFLTGYRGTGKSSVAARLAGQLQRPLIDLDQVIESSAGKSIREIFATGGEPLFRKLESESLLRVTLTAPAVIALGGGAVLSEHNRELIAGSGICVLLTADAETIAARIAGDAATAESRPPLTSLDSQAEIRQLLKLRAKAYAAAADYTIATEDLSIDQVADAVLAAIATQRRPG